MQLVEEAVEGCWIGHRARMSTSEIGSVYSPPDRQALLLSPDTQHVETVIDMGPDLQVGSRRIDRDLIFICTQNWTLVFEKGGIRRVLMNIFGNSLKFTAVRLNALGNVVWDIDSA
jgi:signal transduction histidine kinase